MRRELLASMVVALGATVACAGLGGLSGGGDAPVDGGPEATSAIDSGDGASVDGGSFADVCAAYATAMCDREVACMPVGIQSIFGGPSGCVLRVREACVAQLTAPDVTATIADVDRCVADIPKQPCEEMRDEVSPPSCIFRGTRAVGKPCVSRSQCDTGACGSKDAKGCGKCYVPATAGMDCGPGCANGLACAGGKCAVTGGFGDTCDSSHLCKGTFRCGATGKCETYVAPGQACNVGECDGFEGFVCQSSTCVAISFVQPGMSCVPAGSSPPLACAAGLCAPGVGGGAPSCIAYAGVGQTCGGGPPPLPCLPSFTYCVAGECTYPNDALCTP